jgi:hypothetical protein
MNIPLNIYGLSVQLECPHDDLSTELIRPFKHLKASLSETTITIVVHEENTDYSKFPEAVSSFSTPRNIVFTSKSSKIIDYFGKGTVIESTDHLLYHIYSKDRNFLIEAFYLITMSAFSRFCDQKNFLRIHSLGISFCDKAYLLLMSPGFGKSTLALGILKENGYNLISDDCPLYTKGFILPFPVRIGVLNKESVKYIPDKFVYHIDRMEFGSKYFIDMDFWQDKIETEPLKNIIIIKTRMILQGKAAIKRVPKSALIKPLLRDAVIGLGIYQGMEFLFSGRAHEIFLRVYVVLKRMSQALKLILKSKPYEFTLTRNTDENIRAFREFSSNPTLN